MCTGVDCCHVYMAGLLSCVHGWIDVCTGEIVVACRGGLLSCVQGWIDIVYLGGLLSCVQGRIVVMCTGVDCCHVYRGGSLSCVQEWIVVMLESSAISGDRLCVECCDVFFLSCGLCAEFCCLLPGI